MKPEIDPSSHDVARRFVTSKIGLLRMFNRYSPIPHKKETGEEEEEEFQIRVLKR